MLRKKNRTNRKIHVFLPSQWVDVSKCVQGWLESAKNQNYFLINPLPASCSESRWLGVVIAASRTDSSTNCPDTPASIQPSADCCSERVDRCYYRSPENATNPRFNRLHKAIILLTNKGHEHKSKLQNQNHRATNV